MGAHEGRGEQGAVHRSSSGDHARAREGRRGGTVRRRGQQRQGKSGRIEIYRLADDTLAFVAPPRSLWTGSSEAIDALFADALATTDDATELGELELTSGRLAAVYMWHRKVGAARDVTVIDGGAATFGDGYGEADGGAVIAAGAGTHRLSKRELVAPWDDNQTLVVVYAARTPT